MVFVVIFASWSKRIRKSDEWNPFKGKTSLGDIVDIKSHKSEIVIERVKIFAVIDTKVDKAYDVDESVLVMLSFKVIKYRHTWLIS